MEGVTVRHPAYEPCILAQRDDWVAPD
jgi:hypothetical protein